MTWRSGLSQAAAGVPTGGTAGQLLAKSSGAPFDTGWVAPVVGLPAAGSEGQVLGKASGADYHVTWITPAPGIPAAGTTGQVLAKASADDFDAEWQDPAEGIPAGGSTGQVLTKASEDDFDAGWETPADGGPTLVSAFLTATQDHSSLTPADVTGHTFTLDPGQTLSLQGNLICTSAAITTGFGVRLSVTQAGGAGGNVIGSGGVRVSLSNAAASNAPFKSDVFNVAAGASGTVEVMGTATTAGTNGSEYSLQVRNNGTSGQATVKVQIRSEVEGSTVTAQIGSGCVGVLG